MRWTLISRYIVCIAGTGGLDSIDEVLSKNGLIWTVGSMVSISRNDEWDIKRACKFITAACNSEEFSRSEHAHDAVAR
jgi:hypothetical protein